MKSIFTAVVLCAGALFSSCASNPEGAHPGAGEHPSGTGPAGWPGQPPQAAMDSILQSPSGSRLRYEDNHGRYTITLFPNARYRFVSISQNETMADTTEGRWSWERTGSRQGELTIGGETWALRFVSPGRAEATTVGDARTYNFLFERL